MEDYEFEDIGEICDLLLPFCRHHVANRSKSNRREDSFVLTHIGGSGQPSHHLLMTLSHLVKKMDPFHMLETHMARVVLSFDDNEPE
jgi:hypothetical protein